MCANLITKDTMQMSGVSDIDDEVDSLLTPVRNVNVVTVPVVTQLLSSQTANATGVAAPPKKFVVVDCANGREIFHALDISQGRNDPNIRGITLALPPPSEKPVLHCGYLYSPTFPTMEFSSPNGNPIGVYQRDGFGLGLLGFLCPCFCLCLCLPLATSSIKSSSNRELLLQANAYLFPRKVDISRPPNLGGSKIGTINLVDLLVNQMLNIELEECATSNEKSLVIGLGAGMLDYEQFRRARIGYGHQH